jgi:hypothetical protein
MDENVYERFKEIKKVGPPLKGPPPVIYFQVLGMSAASTVISLKMNNAN